MHNDRLGHMLFEKLGFPTATFDKFQLIISQFDDLGLSVEFSHGL